MAYDFDYPDGPKDKTYIACKATYNPVWPVAENMQDSSLTSPRALASMNSEVFRANNTFLHAFLLLWLDERKSLIEKKVNKMLIQAQGLDAQPGQNVVRSSSGLRVLEVDDKEKKLLWPSSMEAEYSTHFCTRLTEEGYPLVLIK